MLSWKNRRYLVACGLVVCAAMPALAANGHAKPSKAIHMPDRAKVELKAPQTLPGKPAGYKVSLNKADVHELQLLPFVGPQVAQRIIAARPFKSVGDLAKVKGIAPVYMSAIKPHVGL
jgi:DNA uptake protein ComE-like DNA-binding protein